MRRTCCSSDWVAVWSDEKSASISALGFAQHSRVRAIIGTIPRRGATGHLVLGLIWGLVPCGLDYAAFAAAVLAGDPVQGALLVFVFGLGTLPNLLAAHWVIGRSRQFVWPRAARHVMASILVGFGVVGLARAAGLDNPWAWLAICWPVAK